VPDPILTMTYLSAPLPSLPERTEHAPSSNHEAPDHFAVEPAPSPTLTEWKPAYRAAINEFDPKKKLSLCDQANRAINVAILEQYPRLDAQELELLRAALRDVTLHKLSRRRKRRYPSSTQTP